MFFRISHEDEKETYLFHAIVAKSDVDAGNGQFLWAFFLTLDHLFLVCTCFNSLGLGATGASDDVLGQGM